MRAGIPLRHSGYGQHEKAFRVPVFSIRTLRPIRTILSTIRKILGSPTVSMSTMYHHGSLRGNLTTLSTGNRVKLYLLPMKTSLVLRLSCPNEDTTKSALRLLDEGSNTLHQGFWILLRIHSSRDTELTDDAEAALPTTDPVIMEEISKSASFSSAASTLPPLTSR